MCLYALQFFTCIISVDGFSLLFSKLILTKLYQFVFGATFAAWHFFITIEKSKLDDYIHN